MNKNQRVFRVPQCWQNTSRIHPRLRPYLNKKTGKLDGYSNLGFGCYPIFYAITLDGQRHMSEIRCAECASTMSESNDNATVTHADINFEDEDLRCGRCGLKIESAYGDDPTSP